MTICAPEFWGMILGIQHRNTKLTCIMKHLRHRLTCSSVCTRCVQKVCRLTQLTTRYAHHILSLFIIDTCNWNALGPAFLQSSDSVVEELLFLVFQPAICRAIRTRMADTVGDGVVQSRHFGWQPVLKLWSDALVELQAKLEAAWHSSTPWFRKTGPSVISPYLCFDYELHENFQKYIAGVACCEYRINVYNSLTIIANRSCNTTVTGSCWIRY